MNMYIEASDEARKCSHIPFPFDNCKVNYDFCQKCGIIMKNGDALTIKSESKNCQKVEVQPLLILKEMRRNNWVKNSNPEETKNLLEMRSNYMKPLKKLVYQYRFTDKTYFLTSFYIDLILSSSFYRINKNELNNDLIIIGCFLLSFKFVENDPFLPCIKEIQGFSNSYFYNPKEVKKFEELCMKLLNYKLDHITANDYLEFFFNHGIILTYEYENHSINLEYTYQQAKCILADFICDDKYIEYSPLEIACSVVTIVRDLLKLNNKWSNIFEDIYDIKFEEFNQCFEIIKRRNNLLYVRKKNSLTSSKIPNVKFELDEIRKTDENGEVALEINNKSTEKSRGRVNTFLKFQSSKQIVKKEMFKEIINDEKVYNGEKVTCEKKLIPYSNYKKMTTTNLEQDSISKNNILKNYHNNFSDSKTPIQNNRNTYFQLNEREQDNNLESTGNIENLNMHTKNFDKPPTNPIRKNTVSLPYKRPIPSLSKMMQIKQYNENINLGSNCSTNSNSKKSTIDKNDNNTNVFAISTDPNIEQNIENSSKNNIIKHNSTKTTNDDILKKNSYPFNSQNNANYYSSNSIIDYSCKKTPVNCSEENLLKKFNSGKGSLNIDLKNISIMEYQNKKLSNNVNINNK